MTAWRRATTPEEKSAVIHDLEKAWNVPKDLRLGQLIINAIGWDRRQKNLPTKWQDIDNAIFYAEDYDLAEIISRYVSVNFPPKASTSA